MKITDKGILLLLLVILSVSVFSWISLFKIPVQINGKTFYARYGENLTSFLLRNDYKLTFEQKVSAGCSGVFVRQQTVKIYENERRVDLETEIVRPMKLTVLKPLLKWTAPDASFEVSELKPKVEGEGPFIKLESVGTPSVYLIEKFENLGFQFERHLLARRGIQPVYRRTDGIREKAVALTFDDGPSIYTPELLNVLDKYKVRASFFVIGKHVERHPQFLKLLVQKGHLVGNHSYSHKNLKKLSALQIEQEIEKAEEIIKNISGVKTFWFRPPMGSFDKRLLAYLNIKGYNISMWTVDTEDWKIQDSQRIYGICVNNLKPGSVILLHDGGGYRKETVHAVEMFIRSALKKGYIFVTLADFSKLKSQ